MNPNNLTGASNGQAGAAVPVSFFPPVHQWPAVVTRVENIRVSLVSLSLSAAQLDEACVYLQTLINHPLTPPICSLIEHTYTYANTLAQGVTQLAPELS